jgi:hypothetical protein
MSGMTGPRVILQTTIRLKDGGYICIHESLEALLAGAPPNFIRANSRNTNFARYVSLDTVREIVDEREGSAA